MHIRSLRPAAMVAALALPLAACDSATDSQAAGLEVRLSTRTSAAAALATLSPSFSIAGQQNPGMGRIDLDAVESIEVTITDVLVLPTRAADPGEEPEDQRGGWIHLTNAGPLQLDLKQLNLVETIGVLPENSDVGGIAAVRLVFGSSTIAIDGATEPLFIPSGKVTIATPGVEIGEGGVLDLVFLQEASVKGVIRTGRGYLMPPVIRPAGQMDAEAQQGQP
jgi:hypothetical protein